MFYDLAPQNSHLFGNTFQKFKQLQGINSKELYNSERNNETTTTTTFEEFAEKVFKSVYN